MGKVLVLYDVAKARDAKEKLSPQVPLRHRLLFRHVLQLCQQSLDLLP